MGLFDDVKQMLNQYASGSVPSGDAGAHFLPDMRATHLVDDALYAAHPTLVKTLGSAAMMIAMRKIAERHQLV